MHLCSKVLNPRQFHIRASLTMGGEVMSIGVIGMGIVGRALYNGLKGHHDLFCHDISLDSSLEDLTSNCKIAYICIQTRQTKKREVRYLWNKVGFGDVRGFSAVIKSTVVLVRPRLCKMSSNIRLAHWPEFSARHLIRILSTRKSWLLELPTPHSLGQYSIITSLLGLRFPMASTMCRPPKRSWRNTL